MTTPVFTWNPDLGATLSREPSVQTTKFGDGYEVRVAVGLNSKPRKWGVTFTRNTDEVGPILQFLEDRGGVEAFDWIDPLGVTKRFVCRKWNSSQKNFGVYQVTADFEEVFEA